MKTIIIQVFGMLIISAVAVFLFSSCCSIEPVTVEGQPAECNDMYTVIDFLYKTKSKDKSMVTTFKTDCTTARKRKHARKVWNKCKKEFYPKNIIDTSDLKKYRDFSECRKSLK